jgi:hypothetical protein
MMSSPQVDRFHFITNARKRTGARTTFAGSDTSSAWSQRSDEANGHVSTHAVKHTRQVATLAQLCCKVNVAHYTHQRKNKQKNVYYIYGFEHRGVAPYRAQKKRTLSLCDLSSH